MRTYFSIFRLRFISGLQYRAVALAGLVTQLFYGFIYIMIFEAFYQNFSGNTAISLDQLITYAWLQQAFIILIWFALKDEDLFDMIKSGTIAYELARPCNIYWFWYAKLVAQRVSGALLRCFPIIIITFFIPQPYRMELPSSLISFILFVITLLLGLFVIVAISMLIYISVFYTMSPAGSLLMIGVVAEFFAGLIIPIPFMPDWLKAVAYMLPFRLASDLPFRIYSGNIQIPEALIGIMGQIFWIVVFVSSGRYLMKKALKRLELQGG